MTPVISNYVNHYASWHRSFICGCNANGFMKRIQLGPFYWHSRRFGEGSSGNVNMSPLDTKIVLKDENDRNHDKFSLIGLEGSEIGQDRGDAVPKTRLEGAEINENLLALKECIPALDQSDRQTPFRGNKSTHVLSDLFIGNSQVIGKNSHNSTFVISNAQLLQL